MIQFHKGQTVEVGRNGWFDGDDRLWVKAKIIGYQQPNKERNFYSVEFLGDGTHGIFSRDYIRAIPIKKGG